MVLQILAYAILLLVVGGIVWLAIIALKSYEKRGRPAQRANEAFEEGSAELPPGDTPAEVYLAHARRLAAEGRFREAIAQLLLGAMSDIERSGLIRFRRGLTYRDYFRALRGRPQQEAWRTIVSIYEPICFGRRIASADHFQRSLAQFEAGFYHA
jgi:hypothetical protein